MQLTVNKWSIEKFADGWNWTADLWCRKRPTTLPTEPQPLPEIVWQNVFERTKEGGGDSNEGKCDSDTVKKSDNNLQS